MASPTTEAAWKSLPVGIYEQNDDIIKGFAFKVCYMAVTPFLVFKYQSSERKHQAQ